MITKILSIDFTYSLLDKFNLLQPGVAVLYTLKTSENLKVSKIKSNIENLEIVLVEFVKLISAMLVLFKKNMFGSSLSSVLRFYISFVFWILHY